jgi:hypothetical protein
LCCWCLLLPDRSIHGFLPADWVAPAALMKLKAMPFDRNLILRSTLTDLARGA